MNHSLQKFYDAVEQTLRCTYCGKLFQDPIQLRCGCTFCSACISSSGIKTCCKKKVTASDITRKCPLLTDVIDQMRTIRDLCGRVEQGGVPVATGAAGSSAVSEARLGPETDTLSVNESKNNEARSTDTGGADPQLESRQEQNLMFDTSQGDCRPPLSRHSSSTTTLDGTSQCAPRNSKIPPSPLRHSQAPLLDMLSQTTNQSGFVLETQSQTQDAGFEYVGAGSGAAIVVADSFMNSSERGIGTLATIPPRMQGQIHRLFQRREEDDLLLTSSSATLSPTQIVECSYKHNGDECDAEVEGRAQVVANTVPAFDPYLVPDTLLSPPMSSALLRVQPGNVDATRGGAQWGVVADTYAAPFSDLSSAGPVTDKQHSQHSTMTPDSEKTSSSMYDVDSYIEDTVSGKASRLEVAGAGNSYLGCSGPSGSPDSGCSSGSKRPRSWTSDGGCRDTDHSTHDRAVLPILESDWLDDNTQGVGSGLAPAYSKPVLSLPPQSLTQGCEEAVESPAVSVDASASVKQRDCRPSPKVRIWSATASLSTISGSISSAQLPHRAAVDDSPESGECVDSSLYEVSSELSETEGGNFPLESGLGGEADDAGKVTIMKDKETASNKRSDALVQFPNLGTNFSTLHDTEGTPATLASWAQNDDKLLKQLMDRLPDQQKEIVNPTTSRRIPSPPAAGETVVGQQKAPQGSSVWLDAKPRLRVTEKLVAPDMNAIFAASPPAVPHFNIICSSSILRSCSVLQEECVKQGLLTIARGEWGATPALSSSSSESTTHLVLVEAEKCTQTAAKNPSACPVQAPIYQCKRTISFLKGMCKGYWILSGLQWLKACLDEGKVADLSRFEVSRCLGAPLTAAPTRARLSARHPRDPARSLFLDNCTFLLKNTDTPAGGQQSLHTGLDARDVAFMIHYCGGEARSFPKRAKRACLCSSCHRYSSDGAITSPVIVINLRPVNARQGRKRAEAPASPDRVLCHLCLKEQSSGTSTSPFLEVDLLWLVDTVCSFEKRPFDSYYVQE